MNNEDDDDLAVWLEMIRSVKPLTRGSNVATPENKPRKFTLKNIGRARDMLREFPLEKRAVTPSPLPQRQVKKMRSQQIPVEARLDLHGVYVEQARIRVTQFIHQAVLQEIRHLEIITGRGNPDEGTGQLRRLVPLWLKDSPFNTLILHVEPNPTTRGGSLLVLLRRNIGRN